MHSRAALIREFPNWLVEMDIVRSPTVDEFMRHGIDEGPTNLEVDGGHLGEQSATSTGRREKKAPFNAHQHGYLYWPDARVPYAFHPFIGKTPHTVRLKIKLSLQ